MNPLLNEQQVISAAQMLIDYHKREIQKLYPNCNTMEEVEQQNINNVKEKENEVKAAEDTINAIRNIVNNYPQNIVKNKVEPIQDIKVMDIKEECNKYEDLERKFIEKYNLHIKKLSDRLLLKLLNYCLTFKTVILVQGEEATVQILKYFVENNCNVKGLLE